MKTKEDKLPVQATVRLGACCADSQLGCRLHGDCLYLYEILTIQSICRELIYWFLPFTISGAKSVAVLTVNKLKNLNSIHDIHDTTLTITESQGTDQDLGLY